MRGAPKAHTPQQHVANGTLRRDRHGGQVEIMVGGALFPPGALPVRPEGLSAQAEAVWEENIGRVSSTRLATEIDSDLFANYCRLQGAINDCWSLGDVPPAAHLMEARRMQELLGIAGAKSRVVKLSEPAKANPFLRNGRR